jgi:hypothetical protein
VAKSRRPFVLMVDDEPDEISGRQMDFGSVLDVVVREPSDVQLADLKRASLVLVDYSIDRWPERETVQWLSLKPKNGLALAAVLRSHTVRTDAGRPTAFAIYSGKLKELSGGLPPVYREHAVARSHNLEWVFPKQESQGGTPLRVQVFSLADAVRRLPMTWPQDEPDKIMDRANTVLGLKKSSGWYKRAWEDVEQCHPPFRELAHATHGLALLRWLLHRILPYPSFMFEAHYLAARLRVTPSSLLVALADDKKLKRKLKPVTYTGVLADFLGMRWWRAGIEDLLWSLTGGRPFDRSVLRSAVVNDLSSQLVPVELDDPVVGLDTQFKPQEALVNLKDAVEIQPDDWPPYAERAWVSLDRAKNDPGLGGLVVIRDRGRL